jgi:hypothetical protein
MIYNGSSIDYDVIIYLQGKLVDLRYLTKEQVMGIQQTINEMLKAAEFDTMTFSLSMDIKFKYGTLKVDSEDDDNLSRFEVVWTFPNLKTLKYFTDWAVIFKQVGRTDYDENGKEY